MTDAVPTAPVFAVETLGRDGDWIELKREALASLATMLLRRYYAPRWPDRTLRVIDTRCGQVRLLHLPAHAPQTEATVR